MGHTDEIKARLLAENDEFKKLDEAHRGCDDRLSELTRKVHLSGDEELEERTLKKQKLHLKDRMEAIRVRFTSEVVRTV